MVLSYKVEAHARCSRVVVWAFESEEDQCVSFVS